MFDLIFYLHVIDAHPPQSLHLGHQVLVLTLEPQKVLFGLTCSDFLNILGEERWLQLGLMTWIL